jgi:purine nucleosidase
VSVVFADVDTGIDDAMALVYLLASPDADMVGIASTGGNIHVEQVCANNLGLLELCSAADIPVSRGADGPLRGRWPHHSEFHGPKGLGYAELPRTERRLSGYDATTAWVEAARAHPGTLVGLVTGPLTNLALALRTEPALPTLLKRLVIMGGSFGDDADPMAEWNIRVDPEAASEVLAGWSGQRQLPIVCGLDLTQRVAMTPDTMTRLAAEASGAGRSRLVEVLDDAIISSRTRNADTGIPRTCTIRWPLRWRWTRGSSRRGLRPSMSNWRTPRAAGSRWPTGREAVTPTPSSVSEWNRLTFSTGSSNGWGPSRNG